MAEFSLVNGVGTGDRAEVDGRNRLQTRSVSVPEVQAANELGNAYNINTGKVTLSATTGIVYLKNTGATDFILDSVAVGLGSGSFSESPDVILTRNPTGGTLISVATAVDMNQNRNFSSSQSLGANVYKGASGATVTGGNEIAEFFMNGQGRLFAEINFVMPTGSSIAITINPNLSSGTVLAYGALIGHIKDSGE